MKIMFWKMLVNKRRGFNLDYGKVEQFGEVFELEQEFNYKCLILCENKLFEERVGKRDTSLGRN